MTVTYVGAGTPQTSTSSISVPWPTHQRGDVALLFVECDNELQVGKGAFTLLNTINSGLGGGTSDTRITVFWARATSDSMPNQEITTGTINASDHVTGVILLFRGCKSSGSPVNISDVFADAGAGPYTEATFPEIETTVADCLGVFGITIPNDTASAAFSSWTSKTLGTVTERVDVGSTAGDGGVLGVATAPISSPGSIGAVFVSHTNANSHSMVSIALEPEPTYRGANYRLRRRRV